MLLCRWLNTCVPPKFIYCNPNFWYDGIRRWAFGEWLGHEGRTFMGGISAHMQETPESSPPPRLSCEDTGDRQLSVSQEAGHQQSLALLAVWSHTLSLQSHEKHISAVINHSVYGALLQLPEHIKTHPGTSSLQNSIPVILDTVIWSSAHKQIAFKFAPILFLLVN